jgi:hypothetical protein
MNGRTCQLCGKPLSRIRVGTGGDFCSREHRNQYRLRCGMDRLLEANQMASLMRRRENLKPLAGQGSLSAGQAQPRGYLESPAWSVPAASSSVLPRLSPRLEARLRGASGFARVGAGAGAPARPRGEPLPAVPRRRGALLPVRGIRVPATGLRAGAAVLRCAVSIPAGIRRPYGVMLRKPNRPILRGAAARPIAPAAVNYGAPPRRNPVPPRKGNDLRVCAAAGFRIPVCTLRGLNLAARATATLAWPESKRLGLPAFTPSAAYRFLTVAIPLSDVKFPASRGPRNAAALPGLLPLRLSAARQNVAHRIGQAPFVVHDPLWFRSSAGQEDEPS